MKFRFEYMSGYWIFGLVVTRMAPGNFWFVALHVPMFGFTVEFKGRTSWTEHSRRMDEIRKKRAEEYGL